MYAKMFRSMYDGSLGGDWRTMVTFQQLLVLADRYGVVDIHPRVIAATTGIPLEIIEHGIERLEQPDPESRTPEEEGRRIIRLDAHRVWGWRIVNFQYYRQLERHENRREYMREYMSRKRSLTPVNSVSQFSSIAEAEAEAEANKQLRSTSERSLRPSSSSRANKTLSKSEKNRNAIRSIAATALKDVSQ